MSVRLSSARLIGLTLCPALLQGCAAILGSKSTNVAAISQPPGAEVYLDGARVGVTPDTIPVESKKSHTLSLRLPGYKEDSCVLTSSVDGGWIILDVFLGGLVGIIVDAATSEWNELNKKSCNVVLSPTVVGHPPMVAAETQREPATAQPQASRSFQSSAPNEVVSETFKADRRTVVGTMLRTGLATTVEQGPPGIVRVGIGSAFNTHQARQYYFTQLASAYHTWTVEGHPLTIELWDSSGKIGEYTDQAFLMGPGYTTPLDCPENATTGLCSSLRQPLPQEPAPAVIEPGRPEVVTQQPSPSVRPIPTAPPVRSRSGFHFGLGLGAGSVDLTCEGCDFASETGVSGFISLAGSIGEKTLLGIESTGWTKNESGSTVQVYSLMGHVTEYLSTTSGLYLRLGLGLVGYRDDSDLGDFSASKFGASGRLGYELGTGSIVFVPYVGFTRTLGGADLQLDGDDAGLNFAIHNLQVGLSIGAY
jgi:PEGA domain